MRKTTLILSTMLLSIFFISCVTILRTPSAISTELPEGYSIVGSGNVIMTKSIVQTSGAEDEIVSPYDLAMADAKAQFGSELDDIQLVSVTSNNAPVTTTDDAGSTKKVDMITWVIGYRAVKKIN